MSVYIPPYAIARGASGVQRALAWTGIAVLHAAALAWLLHMRSETRVSPQERTLQVSFVSASPERPMEIPEPPRPVVRHEPRPRLLATSTLAPAAMLTPPVQEEVNAEAVPQPAAAVPSAAPPQMTPPDYQAAYLNNPGPQYPIISRRRREEGLVTLKILVSAGGEPEQVLIDNSSGYAELDTAAADMVRKRWRFVPAREGEQRVSAWVVVPISFQLKNR